MGITGIRFRSCCGTHVGQSPGRAASTNAGYRLLRFLVFVAPRPVSSPRAPRRESNQILPWRSWRLGALGAVSSAFVQNSDTNEKAPEKRLRGFGTFAKVE